MPNFDYAPMPMDEGMEILEIFLIFFLGIYLLMFAFMVLSYVLQSAGLYTIAKRRCIRNPWLAWLPVGNMWIMGSISDQYQYVGKGRIRNRRKWLVGLTAVTMLSAIPAPVIGAIMMLQGADGGTGFMLFWMIFMVLFGLMAVVAVAAMVIEYIALYDLFVSCVPENAVLYLVLSIVFPVSLPFFLFFSRKKDMGMPPRKQTKPVEEIPAAEEPAEPTEE